MAMPLKIVVYELPALGLWYAEVPGLVTAHTVAAMRGKAICQVKAKARTGLMLHDTAESAFQQGRLELTRITIEDYPSPDQG